MRISALFAALAAFFIGQAAFADLRITEVMNTSNAPAGSLFDRDWWELTNTGPASVNLNGYKWEDSPVSGDTGIFPNVSIGVGESIVIHQGTTATIAADFRTAWNLPASVQVLTQSQFTGTNPFSGLSGSGDEVNLFDPSNVLLDNATFGTPVSGVSFEWSRQNVDLSASVAGQNGAYQITYPSSTNTAVGSPGTSVPEPVSWTLALVAAIGAMLVRRR